MAIEYAQRQTISAVEMGWSGISISDSIIGNADPYKINESYVKNLEQTLGASDGRYLNQLNHGEISPSVVNQIRELNNICFKNVLWILKDKLYNALKSQYKGIIKNAYRDPKTKGLVNMSPGYNLKIPEYQIETTSELNNHEVVDYLRKYLQENRLKD